MAVSMPARDADYSLDDDGDYFTWTLEELRAALSPEEARVAELRLTWKHMRDASQCREERSLDRAGARRNRSSDWTQRGDVRMLLASASRKLLEARAKRTTPTIDTTLYVSWNAMFVSRISTPRVHSAGNWASAAAASH